MHDCHCMHGGAIVVCRNAAESHSMRGATVPKCNNNNNHATQKGVYIIIVMCEILCECSQWFERSGMVSLVQAGGDDA